MNISRYEYERMMRILRGLPARLRPPHAYTTREHNALRQAHLLRKRIERREKRNKNA